jgi:hypothetical protein
MYTPTHAIKTSTSQSLAMLVLSEHEGVHFDFIPVEGISGSGTPTQPCQICYAACINMMLNAYHSMFLNPVLDKDNDEMISFL